MSESGNGGQAQAALIPEVRLFDVSHTEARRLLATGAPVYLTVNPVEYHGPHLSLHNDRLVSRGLVRALHPRVAPGFPLVLAEDLEVGVDPCPGPGTRYVGLPQARRLVRAACEGLAALGAKRVVLMTFHGSPLHAAALEDGVRCLRRRGVAVVNPFNLLLRRLLSLQGEEFAEVTAHLPDAADRAAVIRDFATDFHAGFGETSLTLHLAPESVHPGRTHLPPCPPLVPWRLFTGLSRLAAGLGAQGLAHELRFIGVALAWAGLRPFPGYTGRPHLASAAAGAWLTERIVAEAAPCVRAALFEGGPSPRPTLRWLPWATLGGRIFGGMKLDQRQVMAPLPAFEAAGEAGAGG